MSEENLKNGRPKCPDCGCVFETGNDWLEDKIKKKIAELEPTIPDRESRGWNYIQAGRAVVVDILKELIDKTKKERS